MSGSIAALVAGGTAGVLAVAAGGMALTEAVTLYQNRTALADRFSGIPSIIFPSDLKQNVPFMTMEFQRYQRRSINQQPFYNEVMKIRLPIPENLSERIGISYDDANLGSAVGAAIEAGSVGAGDLIERGGTVATGLAAAAGANAGRIAGLFQNNTQRSGESNAAFAARQQGNLGNQGALDIAARVVGTAAQVLGGITTNPFQVALFRSPQFRTHSFSWKFIPTSAQESETLRTLIEVFQYHSLPGISNAGAVFFSYPEILKINFKPSDKFLYKFKPCVVKGITVNYAPNSPSFIKNGNDFSPTALTLSIELQEIEIMTKADFLRVNGGYSIFNVPGNSRPAPRVPGAL